MESIIYGFIALFIGFFILFIYGYFKALKDPDVKEASKLGMMVTHYRKYVEADKKIQEIYDQYGSSSLKAQHLINEIICQLPNMNEWRRFSDYQFEKIKQEMNDMANFKDE